MRYKCTSHSPLLLMQSCMRACSRPFSGPDRRASRFS